MSKSITTTALVIKSSDYRDSDKIFTLYSVDFGKIKAIGRGIRKITSRRRGALDSANVVKLQINQSRAGINTIEEAQSIKSFSNIKQDLTKIQSVYKILDFISKNTEEDESGDSRLIFNYLVKYLDYLELHAPSQKAENSILAVLNKVMGY